MSQIGAFGKRRKFDIVNQLIKQNINFSLGVYIGSLK